MSWFKRKVEETSLYQMILIIGMVVTFVVIIHATVTGVKQNKDIICNELEPAVKKNTKDIDEIEDVIDKKSAIDRTNFENIEQKIDKIDSKLDKLIEREMNK